METNLNLKFVRSKQDSRDLVYQRQNAKFRDQVNLTEWDSPVEDQGLLGSCVSETLTSAYELMTRHQQPEKFAELSRLFVYYNARAYSHLLSEDAGSSIRDGLRGIKEFGICREQLWPYDIKKFDVRPPAECYKDAEQRRITSFTSVSTVQDMLEVLDNNIPIAVGINIYLEYADLTKDNYTVTMPDVFSKVAGEHAVLLIGYDYPKRQFIVKNSYGPDWGHNGYCLMPFDYIKYESFESWYFTIPK